MVLPNVVGTRTTPYGEVTHGIPRSRVGEAIELVGLREVAGKRVGSFVLMVRDA
jgi:hypothetical protein